MDLSSGVRRGLWRVASRLEQEVRAYPTVYSAFYRALSASPAVRRAVGVVKSGVREDGSAAAVETVLDPPDSPLLTRRRQAVAVRLGLPAARP